MNLLLSTDVYKVSHGDQYPEGTTKVYSYLCARKDFGKTDVNKIIFFGLQYYIKEYLAKGFTRDDVQDFIDVYSKIAPLSQATVDRMNYIADLGYLPLELMAVTRDFDVIQEVNWEDEAKGELKTVFKDGKVYG